MLSGGHRPLQSATGRYFIKLIDRDGSNQRQLFPFREELGVQLPQLVWSAEGETLLFTYNGNLYMIDRNGTPPKQLTADGQASHPQWVSAAPLITSLTSTTTLTGSGSITTGSTVFPVTPAPTLEVTVTPTQSITRSVTPTVTLTPTPIPATPPASPAVPTIPAADTATITPSLKPEENEGTDPP
ncbi:MAG: hypothetical protein HS126_22615 [Anaerolineales bacterium]|nr:hypothetical protein [Anaerolineales bacterium]